MIVIIFTRSFKNSWGWDLGDYMKGIWKLIWKGNHPLLKNNKSNSLGIISNLLKNLTHRNQLERYDNIIQDQIKEGIAEKVDEVCEQEITEGGKVFYWPHRPVIRESASLNDCLETVPPLQSSVWDNLVRS